MLHSGRVATRTGEFALFASSGASPGTFTQMGWEVDDIDTRVPTLKKRGVVFDQLSCRVPDGRRDRRDPRQLSEQTGKGERAAWFRDSEGNMLGIAQLVR